jgi:myo-inositol-1(or 4)-monophosphatase
MVKKLAKALCERRAGRRVYLQTAIDAVRRAGEIQRQASRGTFEIRKKGTIDLVTEVDVAVEKMVRALIAERYPDHDVLGRNSAARRGRRIALLLDLRSPRWHHELCPRPAVFCSTIALEVDGELRVGAVYDPTREELFTAIAGAARSERRSHPCLDRRDPH